MTDPRPGDAFQPGDVLNNTYRVEALLGRGGTSEVYRARSEISGRLVAIKVLKAEFASNDDYLVLMTREEDIREIRHDAIVRYSENHRTPEGLVYLLMDYIDGPGLDEKLKAGPMPAEDILTLAKRVGEGLEAAHGRSIVHRDLSPDNIILRGDDPAEAVVIDFGIAKDTNPGAETIVGNEFAGKYAYAAPEQLSGKTDARSDIYSLGALLLANFRGKSPDVGANPMEVVQKKNDPLDTSTVPEPLKTLLDKMTAPDPNDRFQSMSEMLAFLDQDAADEALDEATIVVPPPRSSGDKVAEPEPAPAPVMAPPEKKEPAKVTDNKPAAKPAEKKSGGSRGLIAAAVAVLAIGGGAAAYFGGFIGGGEPAYPAVSPYLLTIADPEGLPVSASGYVPNPEMQSALAARMTEMGGTADLTLASGEIVEGWGDGVMRMLDDVAALDDWELSLTDNQVLIAGATSDDRVLEAINARYPANWPAGMDGTVDVVLTNVFLDPAVVDDILARFADCGPLEQINDPGPVGYGPDDPILVKGTVSGEATREALQEALEDATEGRDVVMDADVLNPPICLVENYLPNAPSGDIDVVFRNGATGSPMDKGDFVVGDNPVIDLVIPDTVFTGFLSVSIVDVSGKVYHLLPFVSRPDNSVDTLRGNEFDKVEVRVTFDEDSSEPMKFEVTDELVGKSKLLVIHSEAPLFRELRPGTESAVGYAEALSERATEVEGLIRSLDSRIITTKLAD